MTIPGFGAEASVYQGKRSYRCAVGRGAQTYPPGVVPQYCMVDEDDGNVCCCDPGYGCSCFHVHGLPE